MGAESNMKISTSNSNISDSINSSLISSNGAVIASDHISIQNANIIANSIMSIGGTYIDRQSVNVPALFVGTTQLGPGFTRGGIVNCQFFYANGTWIKPTYTSGNETVIVMAWGGGGGSNTDTTPNGKGSGGGACIIGQFLASDLNSTEAVIVGSGGTKGVDGGNSTFKTLTACGGQGAGSATTGAGAGVYSTGSGGIGGNPLGGAPDVGDSTFGGGSGTTATTGAAGKSVFGGSGGAAAASLNILTTIYGGAGGTSNGAVGLSVFGGNGGNNTVAPKIPGGGASGANTAGTTTTGARGEVRVWVIA